MSDPSQNLQPADIPEALNQAVQFQNAGDLPSAEKIYRRILQTDPRNENALHLLGVISLQEGDLEEASKLIKMAIKVNPDFPAAHNNLGTVHMEMGHPEDGAESFRRAIDCQADFALAHYNLGNAYRGMKQSDEAVASYRKAITLNPGYVDAYNNLGILLNTLGQFEEAVGCFNKVLALNPEIADVHFNLGNTLRDLGRLDAAAENYSRALDLDPGHLKAKHVLAALTDNSTEMPPEGYVSLVFDNFAAHFEHQMVVGNCRIPEILRLLAGFLIEERKTFPDPPFQRVLDMGCGTGLAGEAFRDIVGELHGIDMSEKMLEQARQKNVYDAIFQTGIEPFLSESDDCYDLVLAADVLIYFGPLDVVFKKVAQCLNKGGMFAFSVERLEVGTYVLQPSTRYAHNEDYVLRLAQENGFDVVCNQAVEKMRNDVNGTLFWLEKIN
jgi:predicted TPR repeat methyltransferase